MRTPNYGPGIEIIGRITPRISAILTPDAVAFVAQRPRQRLLPGKLRGKGDRLELAANCHSRHAPR